MEFINQYWPLLVPLIVVQLGLMIYCLVDISRRERVKGPKWLWTIIIIFGELIGPVVYLIAGRED